MDYEPLIYASDLTGNLTPDPLRLDMTIDDMDPIITTTTLPQMTLGESALVWRGLVSDGGPDVTMRAHILAPDSNASNQRGM